MYEGSDGVVVDGCHFARGGRPWRIRGTTYGSFVPRASDGALFPEPMQIGQDMQAIARAGLTTVRTYTAPTRDLLDAAAVHGLKVIAGVYYDDWRVQPRASAADVIRAGKASIASALEVCAEHPAMLAICVGNEVPADLVRVVGTRTVERVLSSLVAEVHRLSPSMLATYASYPTTEYLRIAGQDFASFNVFLEDPKDLRRYLRRLQVQAGDIPVLLSEVGLASEIHGEAEQAFQLAQQLRVVDEVGLAGACVFSWTDEWGVNGEPVEGWGFGLTRDDRSEKLAVREVREWALRDIDELRDSWPRVSVVVCAYNEETTITECVASVVASSYPDLEVLVCDDGSTDRTLELARAFADDPRVRILPLPHAGLSAARNAGLAAATGEIIAYLDADAACHSEWVHHLALSLEDPDIVATGGPNLPVPGAGFVERVVAAAPGSPQHVLVSHDRAEHVPGCNMAFRTATLREIGGFNVSYTSAGDDVDVCWKLLDRGLQIGFAPAAMIRHHRRGTVKGYIRQQRGYGRAERMLSGPHAHRFNQIGQARWAGTIYTNPLRRLLRPIVYHGPMGSAPYQPATQLRGQGAMDWMGALLPLALPLALVGLVGMVVDPAWGLLAAAALLMVTGYASAAFAAVVPDRAEERPMGFRALTAWLYVAQPFVRVWGRLRGAPLPLDPAVAQPAWTGDRFVWLANLSTRLQAGSLDVRSAPPTDRYDLLVSRTPLAVTRLSTAVLWAWEPVWRIRTRPRPAGWALLVVGVVATVAAATSGVGVPGSAAGVTALAGLTLLDGVLLHRAVRQGIADVTNASDVSAPVVVDLVDRQAEVPLRA